LGVFLVTLEHRVAAGQTPAHPDGRGAPLPPWNPQEYNGAAMAQDPRLGTRIGEYRIESRIGEGGMGVVYLAEHAVLERKVALKVLTPQMADDEAFRQRFLRESRLAARLYHPNVIPIHDAGESDGVLYLAMHYVEGTDLATVLRSRGPLSPDETISILEPVAGALDEAHANGLVHRDVKPANIMIGTPVAGSRATQVFLTDFGLVRRIDSQTRITESRVFVGTLTYAVPEMFQGRDIDSRADVYALACVLFECLTGAPPFASDMPEAMIAAHLFTPPPAATSSRPDLPPGIDAVLARGLAKDRKDRYPTCGELMAAAREALERPPVGPAVRAAEPETLETAAAERFVDPTIDLPPLPTMPGFGPRPDLASTEAHVGVPHARAESTSDVPALREVAQMPHEAALDGLAFSPDGSSLATRPLNNTASVWDVNGRELARMKHNALLAAVTFSPKGTCLATASHDRTARLWDLGGQELVRMNHRRTVWAIEFSPDGDRIATSSQDGAVHVWDLDGRQLLQVPHAQGFLLRTDVPRALAFSHDGHRLASTGGDQMVRVWDLAGRAVASMHHPGGWLEDLKGVSFSPDGRYVLSIGEGKIAVLWDLDGRAVARMTHGGPVHAAAFTPDGLHIATASGDGAVRIWGLAGHDVTWMRHEGVVHTVAFGPDGSYLASGGSDHTARLWTTEGDEIARVAHESYVKAVAFSPDGRLLATAGGDKTAHVWALPDPSGARGDEADGRVGGGP
jgi:serine/threonine protein kinase